mgnify:CR=1 FL=1
MLSLFKKYQRQINILLLFFIIGHLLYRVWGYRDNYLKPYDHEYWSQRYFKSQWIVPNSKEGIGDDALYAYAGVEYVNGKDPSLLNPEMPPLGKYLLGISINILGNQNILALITGVLCLIFLYAASRVVLANQTLSLLSVLLFSLEPLFYTQLKISLFDTLYLLFLVLIFYSVWRRKYYLASIFLGLFMGTKFSLMAGVVIATVTLYLLINKQFKDLKKAILSLALAFLTYLAVYLPYFLHSHSIIDFFKLQKFILNFYQIGAKGQLGDIFSVIFLNQWHTWWNGVLSVSEWTILWPVTTIAIIACFFIRKSSTATLLLIWSLLYLAVMCFLPIWPRYLLLLLPFGYILLLFVTSRVIWYHD